MFYEREFLDEDDSIEDDRLLQSATKLKDMKNSRYVFREPTYRKERTVFDLEDALSFDSINYNDEEFLKAFRMTHTSFFSIT
jgi:hypothetical protein